MFSAEPSLQHIKEGLTEGVGATTKFLEERQTGRVTLLRRWFPNITATQSTIGFIVAGLLFNKLTSPLVKGFELRLGRVTEKVFPSRKAKAKARSGRRKK